MYCVGRILRKILDKPFYWAQGEEFKALASIYAALTFCALVFIYITHRAALIISKSDTGINSKSYFEAHLTLIFVEFVLWIILARVAVRFKLYARYVIGSVDGGALDYIANALLLTLLFAIILGISTTIKTLFLNTPYLNVITSVTNLIPTIVILTYSIILYLGSLKLKRILPVKKRNIKDSALSLYFLFLFFAIIIYTRYFYYSAPKNIDDDGLHYFVLAPKWLLITYVLPYIVIWVLGLMACLNLAHYANNVEGKIYRPLFRNLYKGLMMIFIGTYLVQVYIVTTLHANQIGFGLLVIVWLLLLIIGGAYLFFAEQMS